MPCFLPPPQMNLDAALDSALPEHLPLQFHWMLECMKHKWDAEG